jgi:predicted HAD superfamily Cof-like phosphohydrolase
MTRAVGHRDPVEIADATVDLVYVALGMAHVCNLPWYEIFDEVHKSNMLKERATHPSQSKRGSTLDIIKPVFWQPPDLKSIVEKHQAGAHV